MVGPTSSPDGPSVELYHRFLNEKFREFRGALNGFLQAIALDNSDEKLKLAGALIESIQDLRRALAKSDQPGWLEAVESKLRWYRQRLVHQPDAGLQLLQVIMSVHEHIQNQKWEVGDSTTVSLIDFTALYQELYAASQAPKLFDDLINQLQALIDSGHVDSYRAIKQLQKLVATLRKNSKGDIFSKQWAWLFTRTFAKNFTWEVLGDTPFIKQASKALRTTIDELDVEFNNVQNDVVGRIAASVEPDQPLIPFEAVPKLPAPSRQETDVAPSPQSSGAG
jgi:hypothetical protein